MPTQEIPCHEWGHFFDEFSRRHKGWPMTVELIRADIGDQLLARQLPLEGITVELNEIGEDQITIMVGGGPDALISHTSGAPRRVWLKQSEEGGDEALEIESFAGSILVEFRSPALPEMIDGILAERATA